MTKKLAAKAGPKKEKEEDDSGTKLEERLSTIEENFFKEVGEDEEEIKLIKERAAQTQEALANEEANAA